MSFPIHTPPQLSLYPEMVWVKGGSFMMGSEDNESEQPIHEVEVGDFLMGKYPVTNAQFAYFLNEYGSDRVREGVYEGQEMAYEDNWGVEKQGDLWEAATGYELHPVIRVTWFGAFTYCEWLSDQEEESYRLPSEAEWEYAARGGESSQGLRLAGSNKAKEVAWTAENSLGTTYSVGLKLPNALGLHDMNGNVFEWCADHWHENYRDAPKDANAWISEDDLVRRVLRGGSWLSSDYYCRVSARYWYYPSGRDFSVGFRVAGYPNP